MTRETIMAAIKGQIKAYNAGMPRGETSIGEGAHGEYLLKVVHRDANCRLGYRLVQVNDCRHAIGTFDSADEIVEGLETLCGEYVRLSDGL